jgi:hypothetical protein
VFREQAFRSWRAPGFGRLGVVLGVLALVMGVEEVASGVAFRGGDVAAEAGEQIGVVAAERGEFPFDVCEFGARVGWDSGAARSAASTAWA